MQILNKILLAGIISIAIQPLYLHAEDTAAQIAARAALQQKMRDLKGQPVTVTPATPPQAEPVTNASAKSPATPKATVVAPKAANPDLIEQARQATRARLAGAPSPEPAAVPAVQIAPAPKPVAQPVPESNLIEQARQATRARLAGASSPEPVAAPVVQTAPAITPAIAPAIEPAIAPAPKLVIQPASEPDLIEQARQATRVRMAEKLKQERAAALAALPAPELIEQARQATRVRMAELQSQKSTAIPAGQETPVTEPVVQPVPESIPTPAPVTKPVVAEVSPVPDAQALKAAEKQAAQEKVAAEQAAAKAAKLAAEQKKAEVKAQEAAAKAAAREAKKTKPASAKIAAPTTLPPLEGPTSNLPASKDQRLQTLLDQYRADKISAEEYYIQRAKILAEP